jgi:hypothetical protein
VSSLENYDEVLKAVGFFTHKYGKIDWIESNNEYWLVNDSRLRTDFNVTTGIQFNKISGIKEKSKMKKSYKKAGIPTADYSMVTTLAKAKKFIEKVGYPVIVKPDNGVGASDTHKISNEEELKTFFKTLNKDVKYIMEEYIDGDLVSYDAIINSKGEPLFETGIFEPTIMDVVNEGLDVYYYVEKEMPQKLLEIGRVAVKGFGVKSRFIHLEFFKLRKDKEGLGKKGDYIGLETNMRPAGGYTPDMYNYANNTDVYQIWADMVAFDEIRNANLNENLEKNYCFYASRRDNNEYVYSHEQIKEKYANEIMMDERMPDIFAGAMGNYMYTAKFKTEEEMNEFKKMVHEKK